MTLIAQALARIEEMERRACNADTLALCALVKAQAKLLSDLFSLMAESDGVAGLHRNGEVADWRWLEEHEWLASVGESLAALKAFVKGK